MAAAPDGVIDAIRQALLLPDEDEKLAALTPLVETLLQHPSALDADCLQAVLSVESAGGSEKASKWALAFIERLCEAHTEFVASPLIVDSLVNLLSSAKADVAKKALGLSAVLTRSKGLSTNPQWGHLILAVKTLVLVNANDNDGVRVLGLKFVETAIRSTANPALFDEIRVLVDRAHLPTVKHMALKEFCRLAALVARELPGARDTALEALMEVASNVRDARAVSDRQRVSIEQDLRVALLHFLKPENEALHADLVTAIAALGFGEEAQRALDRVNAEMGKVARPKRGREDPTAGLPPAKRARVDAAAAAAEPADPRRRAKKAAWPERMYERLAAAPAPSPAELWAQFDAAVRRVVACEDAVVPGGGAHIRAHLLADLTTLRMRAEAAGSETALAAALLDHIFGGSAPRTAMAVAWLHRLHVDGGAGDDAQYRAVLGLAVERGLAAGRPDAVGEILANCPRLDDAAVAQLGPLIEAEAPDAATKGVAVLADLVARRPAAQLTLLERILDYAVHPAPAVHRAAIKQLCGPLFRTPAHAAHILAFASARVEALVAAQPPPAAPGAEEADPGPMYARAAVQALFLFYFGLCTVAPSLLPAFLRVFPRVHLPVVSEVIGRTARDMVLALGPDAPVIFTVLDEYPPDAEPFVRQIVRHLVAARGGVPTERLTRAVLKVYAARRNALLLVDVIPGLDAPAVREHLPALIALDAAVVGREVLPLLTRDGAALSPVELLLQLHLLPTSDETLPLAAVERALDMCISREDRSDKKDKRAKRPSTLHTVFTQHVVAQALSQMLTRTPLPQLFTQTLYRTCLVFTRLTRSLVNDYLAPLVDKRFGRPAIPKQKNTETLLWVYWCRCAFVCRPGSFDVVLLLLSAKHLQNLLDRVSRPDFTDNPTEFITGLREHKERRGRAGISDEVVRLVDTWGRTGPDGGGPASGGPPPRW